MPTFRLNVRFISQDERKHVLRNRVVILKIDADTIAEARRLTKYHIIDNINLDQVRRVSITEIVEPSA